MAVGAAGPGSLGRASISILELSASGDKPLRLPAARALLGRWVLQAAG